MLVESRREEQRPAPSTDWAHGLRLVEGRREERYVKCVPLLPLAAAAGAFSGPQDAATEEDWQWVELRSKRTLTQGMFVARVEGRSMEPAIPDGAYALFRAPVTGTRQGKTVLVQLRDEADPETGGRYTVKRYESDKMAEGRKGKVEGSAEAAWRHVRISLKPTNPAYPPIVLTAEDEDAVRVVAELLEVVEP